MLFRSHVTWLSTLMMGLISAASGVINVTPGNVGVEQGAAEITSRLLHMRIAPTYGFAASCLFRAMAVIVVFILAPVFSAILARRRPVEPSSRPSASAAEAVQISGSGTAGIGT